MSTSKYYQKQYESFIKQTENINLKEAFIKHEPKKDEPQEETIYTRLRTNPRRR